jgi:plastocyanin
MRRELSALVTAILVVASLGIGYLTGSGQTTTVTGTTTRSNYYNGLIDNAMTVGITVTPTSFQPLNFTVKYGQLVTIVFHNEDNIAHELEIHNLAVVTSANAGQTVEVSFIPDATGTFEYYLPIPCGPYGGLAPPPPDWCGHVVNGNMTVL